MAQQYIPKALKWDWHFAFMLYCGGMPFSEILRHDKFKGLTYNTLTNHASVQGWSARKRQMEENATNQAAKDLVDRINEVKATHQNFILDQIEEERNAILDTPKVTNPKAQKERLENLKLLDDVARKTLGLDEEKPLTGSQRVFGVLIQLQQEPPKPKMIEKPIEALVTRTEAKADKVEVIEKEVVNSELEIVNEYIPNSSENGSLAISPLPDEKNHSTGILSSNNGVSRESQDPKSESGEIGQCKSDYKSHRKLLPSLRI